MYTNDVAPAQAQRDLAGAADIQLRLEKLNVVGSVLMIAAHPDDENTALLAYFARGRKLPHLAEGDLLAIRDVGAYGMALSSNYNSRPRPAEVLVDGTSAKVIRRRETMAGLVKEEL